MNTIDMNVAILTDFKNIYFYLIIMLLNFKVIKGYLQLKFLFFKLCKIK